MHTIHTKLLIAFIIPFICTIQIMAAEPLLVTWNELVPAHLAKENPFGELSQRQQADVLALIDLRERRILSGLSVRGTLAEEIEREIPDLRRIGVDVEALVIKREEIRNSVVGALNGRLIRIAGYAMPLEIFDDRIIEFLLVPYIGACIHVPPPPPNQIVHATAEKGLSNKGRSLYTPVWVDGVITTKSSAKDLFFNDGTASIDIAYTIQVTKIEPYKKK